MTSLQKDRPKVYSWKQDLSRIEILAKTDLLWPCYAYTISYSCKKKKEYNIFEETILRLSELETNTSKLSEIVCLSEELVSFIQNRLEQLGFLDKKYALLPAGQEVINIYDDINNKTQEEIRVATIFVDSYTGDIFPFVHEAKEVNNFAKRIINTDKRKLIFLPEDTKEDKKIYAEKIPMGTFSFDKKLSVSKVIKAIKKFGKNQKQYSFIHSDFSMPSEKAITIHDNPTFVYIHCVACLQKGNSEDLLVSDPFGYGFSTKLFETIKSELKKASISTSSNKTASQKAREWRWYSALKEQAYIDNDEEVEVSKKSPVSPKYSEVIWRLEKVKQDINSIQEDVSSSNKETMKKITTSVIFKRLFEAIEWALMYIFEANKGEIDWSQYLSKSSKISSLKIQDFAKKIGLSFSKELEYLFEITEGQFSYYKKSQEGNIKLYLGLAVLEAANNKKHPLHNLLEKENIVFDNEKIKSNIERLDFLSLIHALKINRDPASHGSFEVKNKNDIKEFYYQTFFVIQKLLIDFSIKKDAENNNKTSNDDSLNQAILKAQLEIDNTIGYHYTIQFSQNLKDNLIKTILSKKEDSEYFYSNLAGSMQAILCEYITTLNIISLNTDDNAKNIALDKMVSVGFFKNRAEIPTEISKVNLKFLRANRSNMGTLGSTVLFLFLIDNDEILNTLNAKIPEFLDIITQLLKNREHNPSIGKDKNTEIEMDNILKKVLTTIKKLMEIFENE